MCGKVISQKVYAKFKDITKRDLKETGCDGVDKIQLTECSAVARAFEHGNGFRVI